MVSYAKRSSSTAHLQLYYKHCNILDKKAVALKLRFVWIRAFAGEVTEVVGLAPVVPGEELDDIRLGFLLSDRLQTPDK